MKTLCYSLENTVPGVTDSEGVLLLQHDNCDYLRTCSVKKLLFFLVVLP